MHGAAFDAVLVVSFGGPERREDVLPFLENVLRGKRVPRARMLEVAEHYYQLGGRSPINDHNRQLVRALRTELAARGPQLPVYWGNRNWHPLLPDTLQRMAADGVRRVIAFVTSAYSSYSGCRQYIEDIGRACAGLAGPRPRIEKIRPFFNHPGFLAAMADRVRSALGVLGTGIAPSAKLLYTAHSIPASMARACSYVDQLLEAARLVSDTVGASDWELVFQSRSGPPSQPWLEPDVCDRLRDLPGEGVRGVCLVPVGFLSDHLEVLYDLDTEACSLARELGLDCVRAGTVGTHPAFVACVRDLVAERALRQPGRACAGRLPAWPDQCPPGCCPPPARRGTPAPSGPPPVRPGPRGGSDAL